MEKIQRNKGITLISLVVTIIILIILAGITINIILGKNGIIDKTQEAKIGTEIGREKEILQLAIGDIAAGNEGKLNFNKESLEKALKDNSGMDGITADKSSERLYIVTFPDSKRQYEVYADGTIADAAPKTEDNTPDSIEQKDENTYLIQSIEDLVILSNTVNAGTDSYEGKTFEIQCDLNFASVNSYINPEENDFGDANGDGTEETTLIKEMTSGTGFMSIGRGGKEFKGNIEGNGHTISNLYINRNSMNQGFIGRCDGTSTSIQNLNLTNVNINTSGYSGAIIGEYYGTKLVVKNCKISGNINCSSAIGAVVGYIYNAEAEILNCINEATINGDNYAGGLIGYISQGTTTIQDCANIANINGTYDVGGIVAFTSLPTIEITNFYNTGKINGSAYIGGIIGRAGGTIKISSCYNTGDVTADVNSGGNYSGGIMGTNQGGNQIEIQNCYNTAIIKGKIDVGGICGDAQKTNILKCYNTGNVIGTDVAVGGISGNYGNISLCYNKGDVTGRYQIGGIIGCLSNNKIENVYNLGKITSNYKNGNSNSSAYVGGIVGYDSWKGNIKNAYNLGEVKDESPSIGYIYAGGIVGYLSGTIENTYNLNKITYKNEEITNKNVGAITGYKSDTADLSTSYYLKGTYSAGTGTGTDASQVKDTEAEMKELMNTNLATLEGWKEDTENINNGYPILDF